jgi:hypothetical protein
MSRVHKVSWGEVRTSVLVAGCSAIPRWSVDLSCRGTLSTGGQAALLCCWCHMKASALTPCICATGLGGQGAAVLRAPPEAEDRGAGRQI